MILFSKLNQTLLGCFDPVDIIFVNDLNIFSGEVTSVWARTKALDLTDTFTGYTYIFVSAFFKTDISVSSSLTLFRFIICKNIFWIKVSKSN